MSDHAIAWTWRSREPAKCTPDENYPFGKVMDIAMPAEAACEVELPYPAPGVGTWIIHCSRCRNNVGVTAAGRADDPTKVRFPCKKELA